MKQVIYDVIVIGGGPSGSTVASVLVDKGHKVLVLEREKFPREHVGESLLPFCYQMFDELGVLEEIKNRFYRKPGVTFSNIDGTNSSNWCFNAVIKDESALSFHVRRAEFDDLLLKNSIKKGAEVLQETKVEKIDFETDKNSVTVKTIDAAGSKIDFHARFIIDATGQDTLLAKQLGLKKPNTRLIPRVAYFSHWVNANLDPVLKSGNIKIVHLEGTKMGWIWMIPIAENRLSIGVAMNISYVTKQRRSLSKEHKDWVKKLYLNEINSSPIGAKVTEGADLVQDIMANSDFSYDVEKKHTERYAIIGDAGGFLDPIFSSGIYLGMKSAMFVGDGVSHWLNNSDLSVMTKAFDNISGAYELIEKLIKTFYEPGSIKFSGADRAFDLSFEKAESAYSILHLILAGDFFTNSKKYIEAIELLRDPKMVSKYKNLIKYPVDSKKMNETCL